jgi:hypothetical protein
LPNERHLYAVNFIAIYSGEDLPLNESDFLTEEEKVLSEKEKEKEKLDRIIAAAKARYTFNCYPCAAQYP